MAPKAQIRSLQASLTEYAMTLRITFLLCLLSTLASAAPDLLPGTQSLAVPEAEVPSMMISGIDRFLEGQVTRSIAKRKAYWAPAIGEADRPKFLQELRVKVAHAIGVRDARPTEIEFELVATPDRPALVAKSDAFEAQTVRWTVLPGVHAEGLLLTPVGRKIVACVVAIPDADQTPEQVSGLASGVQPASQFARALAESGCRVLVPVLIDRHVEQRIAPGRKDGPELTNREYVFRVSYESGRHMIGYEVQKVLAAVDYFKSHYKELPVGAFGYGEGGMIALYAAALDQRIAQTVVSGYFGTHNEPWNEPIDRAVYNALNLFGDAELSNLTQDRGVYVEYSAAPHVKVAGKRATPGTIVDPVNVEKEVARAVGMLGKTTVDTEMVPESGGPENPPAPVGHPKTLFLFVGSLATQASNADGKLPSLLTTLPDPALRQKRQLDELIAHSQSLIASSQETRKQFMQPLAKIASPEKYEAALQPFRDRLYNDLLGKFDLPLLPPNVRTRKIYDTEKFIGYEVMLDVFPEVIAYGVLLLPKDLKEDEKRAVVVCQHGLEGTPQETITGNSHFYHDYAAKLAERGYITFSPQNPYILGEKFRVLSRKAWPIGKTMWSIIIPQHQQILNFLKALPGVDPKRIGFYGLSYGGKTAMRVPAVLTDYCLSICSGDFNEWFAKIVSTTAPFSYVFTHEYEIYEFDLASTFNHAEMAALIAPRPFMVERGHYDGVSSDEYVAWEFAKVRRLFQGQLKIPDRCAIEWFDGPHMINAKGTFEFLDKHLHPEKR